MPIIKELRAFYLPDSAKLGADDGFLSVSLVRNYRNRAAGGLPIGEPSGRRERLYPGAGIRSDRGAGCQRFAAHDLSFDAHGSAYDLSV